MVDFKSKIKLSPWKQHVKDWSGCTECELHKTRKTVVLARGVLPCDILMVGEAPGASEDVLGKPFIGPAGKLLDAMIQDAADGVEYRIAFTNLVACIPIGDEGTKVAEPSAACIRECEPRLKELVRMARPGLMVLVGRLAQKWISGQGQFDCDWCEELKFIGIVHPAAILRTDITQRGLEIQRCVAALREAFESVAPF